MDKSTLNHGGSLGTWIRPSVLRYLNITKEATDRVTQTLRQIDSTDYVKLMSSLSSLLGKADYSVNLFSNIPSLEGGSFLEALIRETANDWLNWLSKTDKYRQNINIISSCEELPSNSFWLNISGSKVGYISIPKIDRILSFSWDRGNKFWLSHELLQDVIDTKFALLNTTQAADLLTELALYDPLTGLGNRRKLLFTSNKAFWSPESQDEVTTLWALMIDIDHFKNVNDRYGHDIWDLAIKVIALHLEKVWLDVKNDMIARFWWEEFAILFRWKDQQEIQEIAERIRSSVNTHKLVIKGEKVGLLLPKADLSEPSANCIEFTVSIGVALRSNYQYSKEWFKSDRSEALRNADLALYDAKDGWRNRVSFKESEGASNSVHNSGDRRSWSRAHH